MVPQPATIVEWSLAINLLIQSVHLPVHLPVYMPVHLSMHLYLSHAHPILIAEDMGVWHFNTCFPIMNVLHLFNIKRTARTNIIGYIFMNASFPLG